MGGSSATAVHSSLFTKTVPWGFKSVRATPPAPMYGAMPVITGTFRERTAAPMMSVKNNALKSASPPMTKGDTLTFGAVGSGGVSGRNKKNAPNKNAMMPPIVNANPVTLMSSTIMAMPATIKITAAQFVGKPNKATAASVRQIIPTTAGMTAPGLYTSTINASVPMFNKINAMFGSSRI